MISKSQLQERYTYIFGEEAQLFAKSPGRINIIGEHTDYNGGFVLPAAIDKAVYVAVGKRNDGRIRLYAEGFRELFDTSLDQVEPTNMGWPNYILGVVKQMQDANMPLTGFNLYVDGDIPVGAGLSSSAALECAAGFALNALFDLGLDRVTLAKMGQQAEHDYAGVKCGIMDQFASILSKKNQVIKLDCRDLSYTYVTLELGDYEILLLNTNVKHALASSAYNDRRAACERAVAILQEKHAEVMSLRDATSEWLLQEVQPVDAEAFRKAQFVLAENNRVVKACEALAQGDIQALGEQLFLAHEGLSKEYEVSCAELDFLVEKVKNMDAVLGARMMGGGFGGCTINIVKKGYAQQVVDALTPAYEAAFQLPLSPIFVQSNPGTALLN